jgi:hypothetical protein
MIQRQGLRRNVRREPNTPVVNSKDITPDNVAEEQKGNSGMSGMSGEEKKK